MLVAPRISECFDLPWSALVCYSLLTSSFAPFGRSGRYVCLHHPASPFFFFLLVVYIFCWLFVFSLLLFVGLFVCLFGCLFVMKLFLLFCEKTKRSGDIFTIGMECQDCLLVCLFLYLFVCVFVCLFVCLFIYFLIFLCSFV